MTLKVQGTKCCDGRRLLVRQTTTLRELYCYKCRKVYHSEPIEKRSLEQFIDADEKRELHPLEKILTEVGEIVRAHDANKSGAPGRQLAAIRTQQKALEAQARSLHRIEKLMNQLTSEIKHVKAQMDD